MDSVKTKRTIKNVFGTLIIPVALYVIFFFATNGRFGSFDSMLNVLRLSVIPIIIAFGLGFNMTLGMWDFSIGAIIYAAAIAGGNIAQLLGAGTIGVISIVFALGIGFTILNAFLYKLLKVPSLVLTVGMAMLYESLPRVLGWIHVQIGITDGILANLPWCFVVFAVMVALFYIIYNKSAFGNKVKAVGANQVIAQNAGIDIMKIKMRGFIFGGIFAGVAAVLYLSNTKVMMVPAMLGSVNLLFNAMMGIFIAFFLQRYCNFVFGIVIGTLSMQILTSGLVALGISGTLQNVTSGLFLLVLLIVSSNQGIFSRKKRIKQYTAIANAQYGASHPTEA